MKDQSTDYDSRELFTDTTTQLRWQWVQKAISLAKTKNQRTLQWSEAREACTVPEARPAGQ